VPLSSPNRLTLLAGSWYAAEFIGDEYGPENDCRSYSPIRVIKVEPMTGRKFFLAFYHANYPEGVRDKTYLLATIKRGQRFLLARCLEVEQDRFLLIHAITSRWLREHFNSSFDEPEDAISGWLDRNA
jgi:hypothetical protein